MTHSYRKVSIIKISGESDKKDKRFANRKLRRHIKQAIVVGNYNLKILREVSDIWSFRSDGKWYMRDREEKYMRK